MTKQFVPIDRAILNSEYSHNFHTHFSAREMYALDETPTRVYFGAFP